MTGGIDSSLAVAVFITKRCALALAARFSLLPPLQQRFLLSHPGPSRLRLQTQLRRLRAECSRADVEKVGGKNPADNCLIEFGYAQVWEFSTACVVVPLQSLVCSEFADAGSRNLSAFPDRWLPARPRCLPRAGFNFTLNSCLERRLTTTYSGGSQRASSQCPSSPACSLLRPGPAQSVCAPPALRPAPPRSALLYPCFTRSTHHQALGGSHGPSRPALKHRAPLPAAQAPRWDRTSSPPTSPTARPRGRCSRQMSTCCMTGSSPSRSRN